MLSEMTRNSLTVKLLQLTKRKKNSPFYFIISRHVTTNFSLQFIVQTLRTSNKKVFVQTLRTNYEKFYLVRGVKNGVSGVSRGNSAIFWATDSIFFMELCRNCLKKLWEFFLSAIFEQQFLDFAWKFVWTVITNYEIFFGQGHQKGDLRASRGNSASFWATDSKFCMELRMNCPNKLWDFF